MEFTLLAAVVTGVAAAWLAAWLLERRGRLDTERPVDTLVVAAATGMLVGRLAAMVGDGVNPLTEPASILIVRAGVDTGFAALGAIGMLLWLVRTELPAAVDALAPVALVGLAGWHGGCLWRGTCLGAPSDLPWAWAQSGSLVTRHPVELYTAALLLAGSVLVATLRRRPWLATGAALAAAAAARLITQPVRPSLTGGPVGWYLVGLTAGLSLVIWSLRGDRTGGTALTGGADEKSPTRPAI